jgi:DNA repair exonuclease SbcCD ATPase subunit
MKLTLTNFRCFKSRTFIIPDTGLILLNAESGGGKTSILKAIYFSLYGKEQRVISHGEKKMKVELEYDNILICRSKGPTKLILTCEEGTFQDDIAQNIINNKFGTNFTITNYIVQKQIDSFFSMSSTDKTKFLYSISLNQYNIEELKSKLKIKIKNRKDKLNEISSKFTLIKELLGREKIISKPEFPLKILTTELDAISEESRQRSKNTDKIKKTKTDIYTLQEHHKLYSTLKSKQTILYTQNAEYISQLDSIGIIDETSSEHIEQQLTNINNFIEKNKIIEILKKHNEEFNTQKNDLLSDYSDKISNIPIDTTDYKHLIQTTEKNILYLEKKNKLYAKIKTVTKNTNLLEGLQHELNTLIEEKSEFDTTQLEQELLESLKNLDKTEGKHFKCPECNTGLCLILDKLLLDKNIDSHKDDAKKIKKNILTLKDSIEENKKILNEITQDITNITQLINLFNDHIKNDEHVKDDDFYKEKEKLQASLIQQTINKNDLEKYKSEKNSIINNTHRVLKTKQTLITDLQYKLKSYTDTQIYHGDLHSIRDDLLSTKNKILDNKKKLALKNQIQNKLDSNNKELANIVINDTLDTTDTLQEKLTSLIGKEEKFTIRDAKISKYLYDKNIYDKHKSLLDDHSKYNEEEKIAMRALSKAEELIDLINNTENEILENVITEINSYLEEWMSFSFQDGTALELFSFKETKIGIKSAIDIKISRNGEDLPLDSISGGEFDRIAFCLFLAFHKISTGKGLLMLDECFSSLHSDLVEDIVEKLKEYLPNQLILMTLHQANTGIFDSVITI